MNMRQKVFLAIVVLGNAALWAVPSDVVELVARDRPTLLGRYSREHFSLNAAVLLLSAVGLYIDRATGDRYRRRWFQVIATALFLVPAVAVIDFAVRSRRADSYVFDSAAYHRPANVSFTKRFEDRSEAAYTYPHARGGFGVVSCDYRTDARGFRNRSAEDRVDIVVLGDSFAEGSKVSDEHPWPVRLAERTRRTVYNLGMSGYAPEQYLASLERYGLSLSPSLVICMLYEGNDFRPSAFHGGIGRRSWSRRLKSYVKQSPLRRAVDRLFIDWFGAIGSQRTPAGLDILSWLPLAVPEGDAARFYAFAPKQLVAGFVDAETIRESEEWAHTANTLAAIRRACDQAGAGCMVVYAPTKAHVVLPLARDRLDAGRLRAFAALRAKRLPPADVFADRLFDRLGAMQRVVARWCASQDVAFVGLTEALRKRAAAGDQVYYTYDQHWTPIGHEVVAEVVDAAVSESGWNNFREDDRRRGTETDDAAAFSGRTREDD